MGKILSRVIDGLDIETFIKAESEDDARGAATELLKSLGFNDVDVVFVEYQGAGARIRARAYIHRSGDQYGWLEPNRKGADIS